MAVNFHPTLAGLIPTAHSFVATAPLGGTMTPSSTFIHDDQQNRPASGAGAAGALRIFAAHGITDKGQSRARNEDNFHIDGSWAIVADGMGGHEAGDVASAMVISGVKTFMDYSKNGMMDFGGFDVPIGSAERLGTALWETSKAIAAKRQGKQLGMGSTATALMLDETTGTVHVAHVGDSRLYRIRQGRIEQLTTDHEDDCGGLTKAMGFINDVRDVDAFETPSEAGDIYLLASDGLFNRVSAREIRDAVLDTPNLEDVPAKLIQMANEADGSDNITAVVLKIDTP